MVIEISRVIRVGFLQQNAFHKEDTYVPLPKQLKMMESILNLYAKSKEAMQRGVAASSILKTGIYEKVVSMKYDIPNDKLEMFDDLDHRVDETIRVLR